MEDDLKVLKVEYLSDHWSDDTQILNLHREGTKPKLKNAWNEEEFQSKMTSKQ